MHRLPGENISQELLVFTSQVTYLLSQQTISPLESHSMLKTYCRRRQYRIWTMNGELTSGCVQ